MCTIIRILFYYIMAIIRIRVEFLQKNSMYVIRPYYTMYFGFATSDNILFSYIITIVFCFQRQVYLQNK